MSDLRQFRDLDTYSMPSDMETESGTHSPSQSPFHWAYGAEVEIFGDSPPASPSRTPPSSPAPPPTHVRFLRPPTSPCPSPPPQRPRHAVEQWVNKHPFLRDGLRPVFTKLADTAFNLEVVEEPEEWRFYVDEFMGLPMPDTEEEVRAKDAIALSLLRGHLNVSREGMWRRKAADGPYKRQRLQEIIARLDGSFEREREDRAAAAAAAEPRRPPGVSNPTYEEEF